MGLNDTPNAERVHIGIFGSRNAGKSSIINAVTGQKTSIVSDVPGTTTDSVSKAMELLPIGPVLLTDTPGYDDEGILGDMRVAIAKERLEQTDIALLVVDGNEGMSEKDRQAESVLIEKAIPYIVVYNKLDLADESDDASVFGNGEIVGKAGKQVNVSALTGEGIEELKKMIGEFEHIVCRTHNRLVADYINPGEYVLLVIPIDDAAPKGRLILPEQQAIRDILDTDAIAIEVKENRVRKTIDELGVKPSLVITDSQVFGKVAKEVPEDIRLTSFSILMARYKGFLDIAVKGVRAIDNLKEGDKVLICEGCTHHRQCDDIGTVKIPALLRKYCGCNVEFDTTAGMGFVDNLQQYSLVIHCGGCMLSVKEVNRRMRLIDNFGVPVTNYGTAIAYMNGILDRCLI
ncbi:MAG: [FeFe] hydrogenase H-cluster maturation GTPase HydF [Lachnospiraceae bacterium]|nr:[FeFe] hydrogenase H-cluster maturation GTPase HydF [Lachnospiraceae bacterium]